MKKHTGILSIILVVLMVMLACQSPLATPTQDLQLSQTQTSLAMTLSAVNHPEPTATLPPTPTETIQPTDTPTEVGQTSIGQTSAGQGQPIVDSANILIYEDAIGVPGALWIVSKAAAKFGGNIVNVGDAVGSFMQNLESRTKWDLIIVASEFKDTIKGDIWTAILSHVDNDPSALITELWYLDKVNEYDLKPFMDRCGIEFEKDWRRGSGFNQIDYEMFWSEPDSPFFNTPNPIERFRFALRGAKTGNVGDFVTLTGKTDAVILASRQKDDTQNMGLITSCNNDTVIVQTFRSHDYPSDEMIALWENYITNTLANHFQAAQ
jgi:hypothetical protein